MIKNKTLSVYISLIILANSSFACAQTLETIKQSCQNQDLSACNQWVDNESSNYESYYWRAIAKSYKNDPEGALLDYNKAISIKSSDFTMYANRADIKLFLKDYAGAVSDLEKAIEIEPTNTDLYKKLSEVKQQTGDKIGAEQALKKLEVFKTAALQTNNPALQQIKDEINAFQIDLEAKLTQCYTPVECATTGRKLKSEFENLEKKYYEIAISDTVLRKKKYDLDDFITKAIKQIKKASTSAEKSSLEEHLVAQYKQMKADFNEMAGQSGYQPDSEIDCKISDIRSTLEFY